VEVIDLDRGEDIHAAMVKGIRVEGVAVIIARGRCVLYREGAQV
jgi:hypothetical protein